MITNGVTTAADAPTTELVADWALLPTGPARDVAITVVDGRITGVTPGGGSGAGERLAGVVLPGFANAHSHAFHRALRGRTQHGTGSFWTWREAMYALAARLDPDRYLALARAVYAEMALAGVSCVGEFHYLHHDVDGRPYGEPNVMAEALRTAAAEAGVRLTLLDVAYLRGGLDATGHQPLDGVQRRFGDPTVQAWATRVASVRSSSGMRVGAAVHSVRAVPVADLPVVVDVARCGLGGSSGASPLHVHLSEQPAENAAALAVHGRTPTALLAAAGALGPTTTAVHATHLSEADIAALGSTRTGVCLCPTTERDLADGIGPARALADAGASLSLGSDQHAIIDLFEEARGVEMGERVTSGIRGRFGPEALLGALTNHGALGWDDAGRIAVGSRADLVVVRTDTVRTAGARPEQILYAAAAADISTVYVDGVRVVHEGRHRLGDVGSLLGQAIRDLADD